MQWISVKDRDAPKGRSILVYSKDDSLMLFGEDHHIIFAVVRWIDGWDGEGWYETIAEEYTLDFTHWMTIPFAPID